jgi:hypothetical protein
VALVRRFIELHGQGSIHRSETDAGWANVPYGDEKLLYIATYGSDGRRSGPKTSQAIHLDRERAAELMGILKRVFPGIEHDAD